MQAPTTARFIGVVCLTLAGVAGCKRGPSPATPPNQPKPPAQAEQSQHSSRPQQSDKPSVRLPDEVLRGVCLAHNWQDGGVDGYGTEASRKALEHLDDLGVDTVSLTPFGWMPNLQSPEVRGDHNDELPDGGEHRSALVGAIEQAHSLEMHVILKPHIWIRGGEWRGRIEPTHNGEPAWSDWWNSYRAFARFYARIAAENDVGTYVVGVELESALAARPEAFLQLVADVREIYDGHVTYGANWNEEVADRIWKRLDSVGVQFYPPLTDDKDPSIEKLRRALRANLSKWNTRARELELPLDIIEVGYKSAATAVERPSGWPQDVPTEKRAVDRQLQKRAYAALFGELAPLSQLRSVSVWKYFTDPSRDEGGKLGFSPRGKPAETVLRRAYDR